MAEDFVERNAKFWEYAKRATLIAIFALVAGVLIAIPCYQISENHSGLLIFHEHALKNRADFEISRAEAAKLQAQIASYKAKLRAQADLVDIAQTGASAAKIAAKKKSKGYLDKAKDLLASAKDYFTEKKPVDGETPKKGILEKFEDGIINTVTKTIVDTSSEKILSLSKEYVDSAFSSTLSDYNDSAEVYNMGLVSYPWTAWFYKMERMPYLDSTGAEILEKPTTANPTKSDQK